MKNNWKLYIEHVNFFNEKSKRLTIKVSKPAIAYFKHIDF